MSCSFMTAQVKRKIEKPVVSNKKKMLILILEEMDFSTIEEKGLDKDKVLIIATKLTGEKAEMIFDKSTDKFVIHYQGVKSHEEEHQLNDNLIESIGRMGFDTEVTHHHDKPKIPEVKNESNQEIQKTKIKVR